ncbi:unnamed protein product [Gemmataceae bacterium]|nr:unnamed protein product [Gemmataceae bacterium]VTU02720.1 unnamed protein product [Gemmataceae bacterium]
MNATQVSPRRTTLPRSRKSVRSVQTLLLELAYALHANRVVRRDTGARGK